MRHDDPGIRHNRRSRLPPSGIADVLGTFTERRLSPTRCFRISDRGGQSVGAKSLNAVEPNNLVTRGHAQRGAGLTFAQTKATIQLVLRLLAGRNGPRAVCPIAREAVRIVARPAQPRRRRRAPATRSGARRAQPQSSAPALGPLRPRAAGLITLYRRRYPSPCDGEKSSEGPALSAVTPPHTVEVIRGTQRETVTLRVSESKGIPHEPEQDQR